MVTDTNYIRTASAKEVNTVLRGIFMFRMIEMQKAEVGLDEEGLAVVEVGHCHQESLPRVLQTVRRDTRVHRRSASRIHDFTFEGKVLLLAVQTYSYYPLFH